MKNRPVTFNFAALAIVPISIFQAKTLDDQIDILFDLADDPATPKDRSIQLLKLIARIKAKS